jgi:1,4-dihydroxy-2-naphthoate octaprenyltransferase
MTDIVPTLFMATRPLSFNISAVPVAVGTAWGVHGGGSFQPSLFLLALACALCLHAGANVVNDVGDEINGADRLNRDHISPYTGGSRFIQEGRLSIRSMALLGAALMAAGGVLGGVLMTVKGPVALAFALICFALALAYSLPPLALATRGLGEGTVALGFGLPVPFAAWLQSGRVDLDTLLAAGVVGCWTAAILICNEMPDIRPDAAAGKRTLVVRLGIKRAPSLYLGVQATASALQVALGWLADLPPWATMPPVLTMLVALAAAPMMMRDRASQLSAIRLTLGIQITGGFLLIIAALA